MSALLEVRDLTLRFGGVIALQKVTFDVNADELFAVIGPNGAGKTSIFNCLSGVYRPQEGTITLDGAPLVGERPDRTAHLGIGRTFQNLGLFTHLDVVDNLLLGRHHLMRSGFLAGAVWFGRARREELVHRGAVEEIIDLLELSPYRRLPVGSLPYGVQKRIELGRALAMDPKLLLLDEPVAGMNLEETEDMARYLLDIRRRLGLSMILVEHDMHLVMDLADRVMALDFGVPIATGAPADIQSDDNVIAAYLGRCVSVVATDTPLASTVFARALATPDVVALRRKELGRWRAHTWGDYAERVRTIARGLHELGVLPGDRVAIHAENRPDWLYADIAVQALGAMSVGIYPTSPAAEVGYVLEHSGARVLIVEDEEQIDKVLAVRAKLPDLEHIIVIDPTGVDVEGHGLLTLVGLEEMAEGSTLDVDTVAREVPLDDAAIIVYTSGTTGPPKGAMLSHRNLLSAAATSGDAFQVDERTEVLSYLPLCHVAERLISAVDAIAEGYVVNFGEDGETFLQDLREVQPTFFLGVPRVWEKMMAGVTIRMTDAGWLKRANYRLWTRTGARIAQRRWRSGKLQGLDRITYAVGWLLLYRPLREKLGLARVRGVLSGAAPIAPQVLEFFWSIGVPVREGYGQTENTAEGTVTPAHDVRLGKVGLPVAGVEVRIAEDGEILTRGPGTFLGYFRDPKATKATVDKEGWLHTGDVGTLDADGFLQITDRKKDIIITAGGKNVSPSEIENKLKVSPFVREAVVVGDGRKFLVALIGIELDTVGAWALQQRIGFTTYADLSAKPAVVDLISQWVDQVNSELAQVETIKRFALLPKELDEEDGEVTATQKVKRRAIETAFKSTIEGLYQ